MTKEIKYKIYFLLIKLPICILSLIILFEILAYLLSDYRAIRHGLDKKVRAIQPANHSASAISLLSLKP